MRSKRVLDVVLVCLALIVPGAAVQAEDAALRQQVQALLNQVAAGFDTKNVERVTATTTPEATLMYLDGTTVTIAQWKAQAQKQWPHLRTMKSTFQVENAQAKGNEAVATYTETHDYTRGSPEEQNHMYRDVSRFRATLVQTPTGWRFKRFVQLWGKAYRDGKPVKATPQPKLKR